MAADLYPEYLRRNMEVAKAVGAHANTLSAIERLMKMKHPPIWMLHALQGIRDRTAGLATELAAWRDQADDAPEYARPCGVRAAVDPVRASLVELVDLLTKSAGFHPSLMENPERFSEFLEANQARVDAALARARNALGVALPDGRNA